MTGLTYQLLESTTGEEVYRYKLEEKLSSIVNFGMGAEIYINPTH